MANTPKLRIIPLGGVDEIGKNMTVFEYDRDIIVVDCGSMFPKDDMLGIDLVIPDASYLVANKERVRGYVFTHGHEDHIGAVPYVVSQVPAPLYGSRLTLALIENKLREHHVSGVPLNTVEARQVIQLGCFTVRFIKVNHSIPGAFALAITCPIGTVVCSGDFKVDYTPIDGEVTDLTTLAAIGSKGALALLCESTNIERPGYTMSERKVADTFYEQINNARGRVIIAMFSSNVFRLQQVVDCAVHYHRKVCFVGRSMVNVTAVAMELGELRIPDGSLIDIDDLDKYRDDELVVLLQCIREHFGKPVYITSGYRTAAHNAAVGGSKSSQHLLGRAADFYVEGVPVATVAASAETLLSGRGGIGRYPKDAKHPKRMTGWVHIDTRAAKSRWVS